MKLLLKITCFLILAEIILSQRNTNWSRIFRNPINKSLHPSCKKIISPWEIIIFPRYLFQTVNFSPYRLKSTENRSVYILLASIATSYDKPVYDIFGNSTLHKFKPFDTGIVIWHRQLQFVTASWLLGIDLCLTVYFKASQQKEIFKTLIMTWFTKWLDFLRK